MKGKFLFMFVLASLLMVGCSQEEMTTGGGNNGNGEVRTSYMAINLKSSDATASRAASGYEDGSTAENKVSKVRFYFFTANGAVANVKYNNGSYVNYYDWASPDQKDGKDNDDVESVLGATVVINTKEGDKLPQMVVAVLNPVGLDDSSKSLTDLQAIASDYASSDLTKEGKFVMFNAVYGNNGAEVCAAAIMASNLAKTEDEAKKSPVTIYVERSVAKVKVVLAEDAASAVTESMLALKDKDGNDIKVDGEQVYLKIGGWDLTAETDNGRLVKKINPGWTSDWWNGTYRSFWAINSSSANNTYNNYNAISTTVGSELYTNENASDYIGSNNQTNTLNRTKVILKGTLCKSDGSAFTIVRHLGAHFADNPSDTETANFVALKNSILSQLAASGNKYYYEVEEDGKKVRKQIGADDLRILVADQQASENSQNNCYVYAQLTETAQNKTWYDSQSEDAEPLSDAANVINGNLQNKEVVDRALVWNSGMTYYYYEIIHNGTGDNATKGVVRNHIYDTKVTKIAGLGTPVYDPDKSIYPEKPDPNDHYIAAQINILSWRIVKNDYVLEW